MACDGTVWLVLVLFQASVVFNQEPVEAVADTSDPPNNYQGCLQKCQNSSDVACVNFRLENIPNSMDCKKATTLDLKRNRIELRTGEFAGFSMLEILLLNRNKIRDVPLGVFGDLGRLEALHFKSNNLTGLHKGVFEGLSSLNDRLILSKNQITQITTGVFETLTIVLILDLDDNLIESIEASAFEGMARLTYLYLKNNYISTIVVGTFSGLGELQVLDLSNNRIEILDSDSFKGLGNLRELRLNSNHITALAPIISMPHLNSLNIQANPLHCNCSNEPLRQWYMSHTATADEATCETPEHFANRLLVSIQEPLQCHPAVMTASPTNALNEPGNSGSLGHLSTTESIVVVIVAVGLILLLVSITLVIRRHRMNTRRDEQEDKEYQAPTQSHNEPPRCQDANGYSTYVNNDETTQQALIDKNNATSLPPNVNGHIFQDTNPNESSCFLPQEGPYLSMDEVNQRPLSAAKSEKRTPSRSSRLSSSSPASPPVSPDQDGPVCEIEMGEDGEMIITPGPMFSEEEPYDCQDTKTEVQYATLNHLRSARDSSQSKDPRGGYIAPRDLAKPTRVITA